MSSDDGTAARPEPVGYREERDGDAVVVIERTFAAPVADVWAAVTEPDRLERWIGTWTGDPASGTVQFAMTAEAPDAQAQPTTVRECDPPRRMVLSWDYSGVVWHVELDLAEEDGVTTLTFAQRVPTTALGRDVGPGWEYYLDRLAAAESGGDVGSVAWPDYEAMSGHYEALFADLG